MKKKILAMFLAVAMLVPSLTACGGADNGSLDGGSSAKTEESTSSEETDDTDDTEEETTSDGE